MPRYEKVDAHTIRIIQERATEVDLANLLKSKSDIENNLKILQKQLEIHEEMIAEAKKLGITPKQEKKK